MLESPFARSENRFIDELLKGPSMLAAESLVDSVLEKLGQDKMQMARFLNTYSYLEYIGAMTLTRSFLPEELTSHALHHLIEENDHARLFRANAEKLAGKKLTYKAEEMLKGAAARNYIYRTASFARQKLQGLMLSSNMTGIVSQYSSLVAELRTVWLFPKMEQVLKAKMNVSIAKIIRDENGHVYYIDSILSRIDPHFQKRAIAILEAEAAAYMRFMNAVNTELKQIRS